MKKPYVRVPSFSRSITDTFYGYHHEQVIRDGEFYEMQNMTGQYFPLASPSGPKGTFCKPNNLQGLCEKEALCYVDGTDLILNGNRIAMDLSVSPDDCPKRFVSFGAYLLIFPDKKYINTVDTAQKGNIEATYTSSLPVSFELTDSDSNGICITYRQAACPENPENGAVWLDTSVTPNTLKQYSQTTECWNGMATTYVKISSVGIGTSFERYDGVEIHGLQEGSLYHADTGLALTDDGGISQLDGSFVLWDKGDDYITVVGLLENSTSISNTITVKRLMPKLDFIIEAGNRLWGCRYGPDRENQIVNTVYCSKLGDFKNWSCFMGISTDSYFADVGTDGPFTGAVTHLGYPIFFKEGYYHKIYGNFPSEFQVQTTACRGIQKGSEQSAAIVNEVLYYKSKSGVMAYDGSLPVDIGSVFGDDSYTDALGCAFKNRYYLCMRKQGEERRELFYYDTARSLWFRQQEMDITQMCACNGEVYYAENGVIRTLFGSGQTDTEPVHWQVQTGLFGLHLTEKKRLNRLSLRLSLEKDSRVDIFVQYDSEPRWEYLTTVRSSELKSFSVPIKPRPCDHFRLKLSGQGQGKLYHVTKYWQTESESI